MWSISWTGKSFAAKPVETDLAKLSAGVLEAVLERCGYEGIAVDSALFQYTNDGVYVYVVATGTCEADQVIAVCTVALEQDEIVAMLLNQPLWEDLLKELPMQGPLQPGVMWR
jgi:hypothetical protein